MRNSLGAFLALLIMTAGCAETTSDGVKDRRVAELLLQGKASLGKNEWSNAKASFERVLRDYDPDNNEARFGSALADTLFLGDMLRYIGSLAEPSTGEFLSLADDESRYLTELISGALHEVGAKFASADRHLAVVEREPRFVFRIDSLPLYLSQGKPATLELRGEWDQADALFLHGIVQGMIAALGIVDSVDLSFDFPRAHAYFTQPELDSARLSHFISLVTYILNDPEYPNFLSVRKDGGKETLAAASLTLADALGNFKQALVVASRERDDQQDDILWVLDRDASGTFDPPIDEAADACAVLALRESEPQSAKPDGFGLLDMRFGNGFSHPLLTDQTFCLLQKLGVNLAWSRREEMTATIRDAYPERPRINLLHDVIPVIDAGLSAVSAANPKLTFGVPVPEGVLGELVRSIVGNVLEIDPQPFFVANADGMPGTLRGLLPVWESYACPTTGVCLNDFVVEMECSPAPATQAVFPAAYTEVFTELLTLPACRRGWVDGNQVEDTAHFGGALAADGFVGYLPYFQWQDASFHGVLYLNPAALAELYADTDDERDALLVAGLRQLDADPDDFKAATLADLNAFTAALSANSSVRSVLFTVIDQMEKP